MYSRTRSSTCGHATRRCPLVADYKPVDGIIGGGVTFPNGEVRDHLGDGYNLNFGAVFNVNAAIGIEGRNSFNGLGQETESLYSGLPDARCACGADRLLRRHEHAVCGTVNLVARRPTERRRTVDCHGRGRVLPSDAK